MLYLDNASTSFPKPKVVYQELQGYLQQAGANPGRGSHQLATRVEKNIDDTRYLLASFFGISDHHRVIFTLNGTDSINIGIKGVIGPGDHVITSLLEHNSVLRPLRQLEKNHVITLSQIDFSNKGFIDPDDFRRAITPRTKLVVLLHASNVLGTIQPIEAVGKICREHDLLFLVDAAQTAGILPIDIDAMKIDLLAFPGHKALFGPPGVGVLIVGERARLSPWREGGTGMDSENPLQPRKLPFLLESGTPNTLGIVALKAGLQFLMNKGLDKMRQHDQCLLTQLIGTLRENRKVSLYGTLDVTERVGLLALNWEGYSSAEVGAILDVSFQIAVRPGLHCAPFVHKQLGTAPDGALRISPGYFNTEEEICQCLAALEQL